MRSFQTIVALLFALFAFAFAQDYETTVYVTSTVYRVNTVTMSGTPSASVANSTSTAYSTATPPAVTPIYSAGNGTTVAPTGSSPASPSTSAPVDFPGAASTININAFVAVLAAGVAYMAL
jgi:hypothetical protein